MINFSTTILKYDSQGEKTGWTYIVISPEIAARLKPGNKKSFRVKGKLDRFSISGVALLPIGGGSFVMALNAAMRKGIGKRHGAMLKVQLTEDTTPYQLNADFLECLNDEPAAVEYFNTLSASHQRYFSKWIDDAKTLETKAKRIAMAVTALSRKMGYGEMIRSNQKKKLPGQ